MRWFVVASQIYSAVWLSGWLSAVYCGVSSKPLINRKVRTAACRGRVQCRQMLTFDPKVNPEGEHGRAMPLPKNLPRSDPPTSVVPSSALAGKKGVLANRYCIEHKLGSGAFGCAYLVTDLKAVNNERWVCSSFSDSSPVAMCCGN